MAKNTRQGGGARMKAAAPKGTVGKPSGLKPKPPTASRLKAGDPQSVLGKVAQRRAMGGAAMRGWQSLVDRGLAKAPHRNQTTKGPRIRGTVGMGAKAKVNHYVIQGGQRVAGRAQSKAIRAQAAKPMKKKTEAKVRKLSYDQRVQSNEAKATGVRQTADTMRTTLPKSMRDAYKVSTVGGLVLKYAGTSGIGGTQYSRLSDVVGAAGLSNIKGIRVTTNPNRSLHISLSRIARAQAAIGEKVASRPRRRRR